MIVALSGSPASAGRVTAALARESPSLHVYALRRSPDLAADLTDIPDVPPPDLAAALADIPDVPPDRRRVPILCECSDYSGGPLLATRLHELAAQQVAYRGKSASRLWDVIPIQAVPADRYVAPASWRHDVPRRDLIAAFLDLSERRSITIDRSLPLSRALLDGIAKLRARRDDRDDERINEDEDLALCVAVICWWYRLTKN